LPSLWLPALTFATVALIGLAVRFDCGAAGERPGVRIGPVIGIALVRTSWIFADKIPWPIRWDLVHTAIRPIGGAFIAVATLGEARPVATWVAALGGTVATSSHLTKTGTRAGQYQPEPFSNWALSVAEDAFVVRLAYLALRNPVAALVVAVVVLVGIFAFSVTILRTPPLARTLAIPTAALATEGPRLTPGALLCPLARRSRCVCAFAAGAMGGPGTQRRPVWHLRRPRFAPSCLVTLDGQPVTDLVDSEVLRCSRMAPRSHRRLQLVRPREASEGLSIVVFVDTHHTQVEAGRPLRAALARALEEGVPAGTRVALTSPELVASDLVFGSRAEAVSTLSQPEWSWVRRSGAEARDPKEALYDGCFAGERGGAERAAEMKARRREKASLDALDDLIAHVDGRVDAASLNGFIASYQSVEPL
jgi:hypothetical protein